jgi:hypothetical protein
MTLNKLAALAKYRSLQLIISLELDYILSGTLRAQKPGPDSNARALAPLTGLPSPREDIIPPLYSFKGCRSFKILS